MATLAVRNQVQKVLFERVLKGQISDGMWENASPHNHHQYWCNADVIVADAVGRDFWAPKDNYNFLNAQLLEAVGDRMLFLAKFTILHPEIVAEAHTIPSNMADYGWYVEYVKELQRAGMTAKESWYIRNLRQWERLGITRELMEEVEQSDVYTMRDLRKDLNDLKKIARTTFHRMGD